MSTVMFHDLSALRGCLSSQRTGSNVHKPESVLALSSCAVAYQLLSVDYQACFPVISQEVCWCFLSWSDEIFPHFYWHPHHIDGSSLHLFSGCSVVPVSILAVMSQYDNKQSCRTLVNLLDSLLLQPFQSLWTLDTNSSFSPPVSRQRLTHDVTGVKTLIRFIPVNDLITETKHVCLDLWIAAVLYRLHPSWSTMYTKMCTCKLTHTLREAVHRQRAALELEIYTHTQYLMNIWLIFR